MGGTSFDASLVRDGVAAMRNEGNLLCTDLNEKRLPRLGENLARLGVTISATAAFDWTAKAPAEWDNKFDAILLDAPCSASGTIRRHPEVMYRARPAVIEQMAEDHQPSLVGQRLEVGRCIGRVRCHVLRRSRSKSHVTHTRSPCTIFGI